MSKRDMERQRAYQRQWVQRRRASWIAANGPCKRCGSDLNLEVDHIDPTQKEHEVRNLWSRKNEIRESELAKCQVLCEKCHMKKTIEWSTRNTKCGSVTRYKNGCRCRDCISVKVDEVNQWRWKTGRRKKTN